MRNLFTCNKYFLGLNPNINETSIRKNFLADLFYLSCSLELSYSLNEENKDVENYDFDSISTASFEDNSIFKQCHITAGTVKNWYKNIKRADFDSIFGLPITSNPRNNVSSIFTSLTGFNTDIRYCLP